MFDIDIDKNLQHGTLNNVILNLVREHFSISNPSYAKLKFQNRFIPKRLYCITPSGKFDVGLYGEINNFLLLEGYKINVSEKLQKIYKPKFANYYIPKLKYSLRDYQEKSVNAALEHGRGVVILPTAAGKTLTIATLISSIFTTNNEYKILIIVPNLQLIKQTYNDFIDYGISEDYLTKWSGDNIPDLNKKIIIAGLQILHIQYPKFDTFLKNINVLIVDECHKLRKNNKFNNILKYISTPHRFGFTGTLPSDKIDQWNILGKFGPILYEEKSSILRDKRQIANVKIQIILLNYLQIPTFSKSNLSNPTQAYEEEFQFIINSLQRNNKISYICSKTDKNTLIMVERIAHGEILLNTLKNNCYNKNIYFIQGSVDVEVRENIRKLMEEKDNIICIAISKVFAEGINIKNLHYIIFASSGKAKIKILQSIGRGLRLHPTKTILNIFDISDNLKYGKKHLEERIKLYDSEKIQHEITEIQL